MCLWHAERQAVLEDPVGTLHSDVVSLFKLLIRKLDLRYNICGETLLVTVKVSPHDFGCFEEESNRCFPF